MPGSEIPPDLVAGGTGPSEESTLVARDGTELAVERWIPEACRGHVVLVHGYAEHKGRYRELVAVLTGAGYGCHLLDLRGHGLSGGPRGTVTRFADYRSDLDVFLEHAPGLRGARAAPTAGGLPVYLLGHSLGGLIALDYVLHRSAVFDALALSSPFLSPDVPWPIARLAGATVRLVPGLVAGGGIDAKWLSHDPEVVEAYVEDPLVFKEIDPHWFLEAHEAQREVYERAPEIRLPALVLLAGDDRIAGRSRSEAVFERLGSARKRLEIYEGFYHEIFNEVGRERVIADLLSWMRETESLAG